MDKPNWHELSLKSWKKDRPLDMFGESLLFVHRLYNRHFGPQIRKVPAHMPHMLNKNILNTLQEQYDFFLNIILDCNVFQVSKRVV